MKPTAPVHDSQPKAGKKSQSMPPDERFWIRYSQHHEFPLSSVTSIACHVLVFGLLFLGIRWFWDWIHLPSPPLPVNVIQVGGGGGNPDGIGRGPGTASNGSGGTDTTDDPGVTDRTDTDSRPTTPERATAPKTPQNAAPPLPEFQEDPVIQRLVQEGSQAVASISRLQEDTRKKLLQGLASGKGQGGRGRDGGRDKGTGTGTGDGKGSGTGTLNDRIRRLYRWTMIFNTRNGEDYAQQLHELGAILAIPHPRKKGEYIVIRDLGARPATGKVEDLAQIKQMYWVDDKGDSIRSLSHALGLDPLPRTIIAFFPEELENKLLKLELQHGGRREEEIKETRFEIQRMNGKYEPRVMEQFYNDR